MADRVRLEGGPYAGAVIVVPDAREPLLVEGDAVPEGMVARYRPTREPDVLRFRDYDRVVARIPRPGG